MEQGFREFFARHDPKHPPEYVKWGLGGLDQEVHAAGGDMVVIGGYPSAGKTAFALQIAFAMARTRRVGFFSYETAADKLHDRTVACQAQLSFRQIMTGKLEEADYRLGAAHHQVYLIPGQLMPLPKAPKKFRKP